MDTLTSSDSDLKTLILNAAPPKNHTKRWLIAVAIMAIALLAIWFFWQSSTSDSNTSQYETTPVTRGDLTIQVTATGTLQPLDKVEMSSETSGTVKTVLVEENDLVKSGQVLLELDTKTLEAQVQQAKANVQMAHAQIRQSEINLAEKKLSYKRNAELQPKHLISEDELNRLKSAYLRATADLQSSQANLLQLKAALALQLDKLSKATILSPFNGVILSREIDPGQTVVASLQAPVLFTLARNLTQMELLLDIDEADIGSVTKGQSATFTVDAFPKDAFDATITKVHLASQTIEGVVTYPARLHVNNPQGILRPGMTSTADITVARVTQALLVPNTALRFEPPTTTRQKSSGSLISQLLPKRPRPSKKSSSNLSRSHVWILENKQPKLIEVTTGVSDGIHTQILSGLSDSDIVIVDLLSNTTP
ncbi:MAG: efflux RND transporter periplasmic adaptor subunit [Pseudomonadota bacterium]